MKFYKVRRHNQLQCTFMQAFNSVVGDRL